MAGTRRRPARDRLHLTEGGNRDSLERARELGDSAGIGLDPVLPDLDPDVGPDLVDPVFTDQEAEPFTLE